MNLQKLLPICAAVVAMGAVQSLAADLTQPKTYHPYVEVFGGFDVLPGISASDHSFIFAGPGKVNTQVGEFAGLAVGMELNDSWRVEAELSHSHNGVQNFAYNNGNVNTYGNGAVNQTYALANVWYDFHNQSAFVPYLGGGVGLGWANGNLDLGGGSINATSSAALAFQVGAGVVYDVSDRFSIDVGYRFKAMTGLNPLVTAQNLGPFGPYTVDQTSLASHNFQIGAVLHF
jgi:opacity protein-like surface antigen